MWTSVAFALVASLLLSTSKAKEHLLLTALLSDGSGELRFECWQLDQPLERYPTIGKASKGFADASNISYVQLPPESSEGLHKPPHPMQVSRPTSDRDWSIC